MACDVWRRLPVASAAAVLALDVFAPRNGAELRRILNPAGRLVVVTPADDHLRELAGALGLLGIDERKQERLAAKLGPYFEPAGQREYRAALRLSPADALAAAQMGPAAWHTDQAALAAAVRSLPGPMTGHGVGAGVGLPARALTRAGPRRIRPSPGRGARPRPAPG